MLFTAILAVFVARNTFYTVASTAEVCSFLYSDVAGSPCDASSGERKQSADDLSHSCRTDIMHKTFATHGLLPFDVKSSVCPLFALPDRNTSFLSCCMPGNFTIFAYPYWPNIIDYYVYTLGHILI